MYIIVETYIDIAFTISMINCFTKNLEPDYFNAIDQILRNLASSQDRKIKFGNKSKL